MGQLPTELYRDIIENVTSHRDLYTLLLTSHSLRYEAERVLFREIDMRPNDGIVDRKPFVVRLFERIRRSPQLAIVVHRLVYYRQVLKEELLVVVIPLMKEIRHLCFATQPHPIFDTCPLQLTSFSFIAESLGRRTEILQWISYQMVPFLNSQHSLTDLSFVELLSTTWPLKNLASTSLSNLDNLTFHPSPALACLLRSRRVPRLNTLHKYPLSLTGADDYFKHLRVLVCLRLDNSSDLSALAGVEYFQTTLPFHGDRRYFTWQIEAMPLLRKLVFMTDGSDILTMDQAYAGELFDLHPGLWEIEVRQGSPKPRLKAPIVGTLYRRDTEQEIVTIDWDEWKTFPCVRMKGP